MRYPIAIEPGTDATAWGVVVPDLPGCFSAGDTLPEALTLATQAVDMWIAATLNAGGTVPEPSSIEALSAAHAEFQGWVWALVPAGATDWARVKREAAADAPVAYDASADARTEPYDPNDAAAVAAYWAGADVKRGRVKD